MEADNLSNIRKFVRRTEWGHVLVDMYIRVKMLGYKEQVDEMIDELMKGPDWKRRAFKMNLEIALGRKFDINETSHSVERRSPQASYIS